MNEIFCLILSDQFFVQAVKGVEVDPEAAQKILICRDDVMHALENDIKPVCLIKQIFCK